MSSISFSEVPANAFASGVFVEQEQVNRVVESGPITQRVLLIGQANTGKTMDPAVIQPVTSVAQARARYGNGSMLALMCERILAVSGSVEVYVSAFGDADLTDGAASVGSISVTGAASTAGTLSLYIAGQRVLVSVANEDLATAIATKIAAAINANVNLPVTAEVDGTDLYVVNITAKFDGVAGDQITVRQNVVATDSDSSPVGPVLTISDLDEGAGEPDIDESLDAMGNVWYTTIGCGYTSTDAYGKLKAKGDLLSNPIEKRMFVSFMGSTLAYSGYLTALGDFNSQWVSVCNVPLSESPAFEIAASVAGAASRGAQADPARPARSLVLTGIRGANEGWTYTQKNAVVQAGGGTTNTGADDTVAIEDLVTTLTTDSLGNLEDAWRFVETVYNIQTKIYQLDTTFSATPFTRAVVVDDDSVTGKAYAIRPKTVKAYAIQLVDAWVAEAWSRERDLIVAGIVAEIDASNAGRINLLIPDIIAAGLKVVAVKYEWAFQAAV
jgi:phage tail sheath gpL-like